MKRLLSPLLALPLLLGACSTFTSAKAPLPAPPSPVRIADVHTVWGNRPSYDPKGQFFMQVGAPNLRLLAHMLTHDVAATLDLLVNRDGTVQEAAVVASSGDRRTDLAIAQMYGKARYSLPLGTDDAAPYVVRQSVVIQGIVSTYGPSDYSSADYYPTSSPQYSNPGNSNTVNGFPR